MTPEQGLELFGLLTSIGIRYVDSEVEDCFKTALRYRVAFYDATYLSLASTLEADLWTGDHKFFESVRSEAPFVRWIGDYTSS